MSRTISLSFLALFLTVATSFAQVTSPTNNSLFGGQFVGFSGGGGFGAQVLEIRNNFNEPITFHTFGTQDLNPYAIFQKHT